jgi:hypothetical protein
MKMTTQPTNTALAPVPDEIEREEQHAVALRDVNLTKLALIDPDLIEARLTAREKALAKLREVAIRGSHAFDWTLYKDKEGRVVGVPRDSAAVQIRKWMGISIFNYRPCENGYPAPLVTKDRAKTTDRDGKVTGEADVTIVEMWADGVCSLTGEPVEGVYYAVRSDKPFTGSGTLQDLKSSCRTGLDAKVTRILSGLRKVPVDQLQALGVKVEQSHTGMGFGTSAERTAGTVTSDEVKGAAAKLREEILRRVGGDTAAAKDLCRQITKGDKPGKDGKLFPGFDTVDRLTADWQVEAAMKKLHAHPMFGDAAQGQGDREPGGEG